MAVRPPAATMSGSNEWTPIPDPTVLTTQQLITAIENQRDLFDTRLEAMDKAIVLLQEMANRSPTIGEVYGIHGSKLDSLERRLDHKYLETATDIQHLRDLHFEKIEGLDKAVHFRFIERDKRAEQLSAANLTAVNAAWLAQKEATTKSEVATSDSIKQLQALLQTAISGLNTQVLDVKSRLDKGEGGNINGRVAFEDNRIEKQDNSTKMFAIIAVIVSVFVGVVELRGSFQKESDIQRLQTEQSTLSKNAARDPVERNEINALLQRLDALSARLNSVQVK